MIYRIIERPSDVKPDHILVDSTFGAKDPVQALRIDHHVDSSLTSLDSVYVCDVNEISQQGYGAIVSNYIDSDAIIGAAVLSFLLEFPVQKEPLIRSDLGKILYSACCWCDYQVGARFFKSQINAMGNHLELWLRSKIKPVKYKSADSPDLQNTFSDLIENVISVLEPPVDETQRLLGLVSEFDYETEFVKKQSETAAYVSTEHSTEKFGVILVENERYPDYITPRMYFHHFDQPFVLRIVELPKDENDTSGRNGKPYSVFIGVNPLIPNWESYDLHKLAADLNENFGFDTTKGEDGFSGRRSVIGADLTREEWLATLKFLRNYAFNKMITNVRIISIYSQVHM